MTTGRAASDSRRGLSLGRLALAALALLPAACAGTGLGSPRPPIRARRAPAWSQESLTWNKLASIESWLDSPEAAEAGFWRVEARLQLSEGRVNFTRRDLADGATDRPVLEQRLAQARHGFQQVLTDPDRDVSQSNRAYEGLDESARIERSLTVAPEPPGPAPPDRWVTREQWGATPSRTSRLTPHDGRWTRITVHHSAMSDPLPMRGPLNDSIAVVRRIQRAHTQARGWGDVGYHYLIDPYGRVFEGRSRQWQGAHAGGQNNVGNIGICLLGNFQIQRPTSAALAALEGLIETLRAREGIAVSNVTGHSHFGSTECPGSNLASWLSRRYRS